MSINLGILAHVDAGKTTLTEGLLYHAGVIRKMGRVDSGDTTTDSMPLERQRGMTIRAATVSFEWGGVKINLIDTPGHMDFIAEVERSLATLDGVILVLSGREGVQPQTRVLFRRIRERRIPALLYINKLDRLGADLDKLKRDICDMLTPDAVYLMEAAGVGTQDVSIRSLSFGDGALRDAAISLSDTLMEQYISGAHIAEDACRQSLIKATRGFCCYPVLMGAALRDIGVAEVLPAVTTYFAGRGDPSAPLSALVYKVEWIEQTHKRIYLRLFDGSISYRERVDDQLLVRSLFTPRMGELAPAGMVTAGDIAVLMDVSHLRCGDWIGSRPDDSPEDTAQPLLISTVTPDSPARRSALITALTMLTEEDPFIEFGINGETGELSVKMFGALQIEILKALLMERFGLAADCGSPRVIYKVKPLTVAEAGIHINERGNQHRAGIVLRIEPLPQGCGIQYETAVSFGDLTVSPQNGVREGVLFGLNTGAGECGGVVDAKVTFIDMEFDSVTSTPADYRRLAPMVVKKALEASGTMRLTPWQSFDIICQSAHQKAVLHMLGECGAVMDFTAYDDNEMKVRGIAPLDKFQPFLRMFQSVTAGQGVIETAFARYM